MAALKRYKTVHDVASSIISKSTVDEGCLITSLAKDKDGYGQVKAFGRQLKAHRIVYEAFIGNPSGLIVMHTCDNPSCVLLEHLKLGTVAENNRDRNNKGRSATGSRNGTYTHPETRHRGSANGSSKLNEEQVASIKSLHGNMSNSKISRMFGISGVMVGLIVNGKKWTHV